PAGAAALRRRGALGPRPVPLPAGLRRAAAEDRAAGHRHGVGAAGVRQLSAGAGGFGQGLRASGQDRAAVDPADLLPALRRLQDLGIAALRMNSHVRELREKAGWSQAALAERLGVSRQTVNAIETGKYDPSLPLAFRLARLFEQSIETIFIYEEAS